MKGTKFVSVLALSILICSGCQQQGSSGNSGKIGIAVIQAQDGKLYDGACVISAVQNEKQITDCPTYVANNQTMGTTNPADFASGLVAEKCNCNYNNWYSYYSNPTSYYNYYVAYDPYTVPGNTFGQALGFNTYYTNYLYNQLGYNTSYYNINSFGSPGYNYTNYQFTTNYNQGSQWWNYYWWL